MLRLRVFALILFVLVAAACGAKPAFDYRTGTVLLEEDFAQDFVWERYRTPDGATDFRVEDGVYRLQMDGGGYNWALNSQVHSDVVIEVYSAQRSSFGNNAYGVVCRADPGGRGDGYYFYISGDGYWSIRKSQGRTMTSLVDFTRSDAIHQGQSLNLIRVLCVEDYLALYVNEQFVGDVIDRSFASGVAGFTAAVPEEGDVDVSFDNLRIIEARLVRE